MASPLTSSAERRLQYTLQLVQVFFVGLTLGMTRTVVPAVAESDFGVARGNLALIATFVIAFGIVKGVMNFAAGALSETLGRKRVLVIGWIVALPIPWMIWSAPREGGWNWIVAATVLLGVNQGLTWSMTLTSKLDLTRPERRGLTNGLNEFCGYFAVAVAGVITAYLSDRMGARAGLLAFGFAVIVPALAMAVIFVRETHTKFFAIAADSAQHSDIGSTDPPPSPLVTAATPRPFREGDRALRAHRVISLSVTDPTVFAICQCGLIEKFIDALVWIILPLFLTQGGIDLKHVGWIPGAYATTWGLSQIVTGPLSDRVGRKPLIVGGMLLCALAIGGLPLVHHIAWWTASAALAGLGMAMLYPTLGAAVSDLAPASWRGAALGVYRFWRDLGYAIGAVALALTMWLTDDLAACFWMVAICVGVSAATVWTFAAETYPRKRAV